MGSYGLLKSHRLGTSVLPVRLFGKIDYKRARYIFHPDFLVRQALFVDSKAEKASTTATIQMGQTSLRIRQRRAGQVIDLPGGLAPVISTAMYPLLTTTIFVKYDYREQDDTRELTRIFVVCLPSGMLQDRYNPSEDDTFWMAGRDAPTLGEAFRVRISLQKLKARANWRVQSIATTPEIAYRWES